MAPDWPEWQEGHFRAVQHITYILRAAHINAQLSEPARRLHKYGRISPSVTYSDPAVSLSGMYTLSSIYRESRAGLDAFLRQMDRLAEAGCTSEPNMLFGHCQPPKKEYDDPEIENPWSYDIIVDYHLNMPIPEWWWTCHYSNSGFY